MKKPETLLEKALAIPLKRKRSIREDYSPEKLDLVFAYAKGEIAGYQFSGALGRTRTNLYFNTSAIIFEAIRRGDLVKKEGSK